MRLIQHRRGIIMVVIAATAVLFSFSLSTTLTTTAHPQQEKHLLVQTSSSTAIPFEPPVVHPGYGSDIEQEALADRIPQSSTRNLLFRNEDRKAFKALHPFLLEEPRVLPAKNRQQGTKPSKPSSK